MGLSESSEDHYFKNPNLQERMLQGYKKKGNFDDKRFGRISIYRQNKEEKGLVMFKEKWITDKKESLQIHAMIQARRNIVHPNLAIMPIYEIAQDKQGLQYVYRHLMGFEFFTQTLEDEIKQRDLVGQAHEGVLLSADNSYSEPEIWYILTTLISVIKTFESYGYHHGDIQPMNIFVDEEGKLKLIDNSLVNYGEIGYQKMMFDKKYKAILSPIQLNALDLQQLTPVHDKPKSDIFAAGITVLSAATNNDWKKYYAWDRIALKRSNTISTPDPITEDCEYMLRNGYSTELVMTIKAMLEVDEKKRPSPSKFHEHLEKSRGNIKLY